MQKVMVKDALEIIHQRKSVRTYTGELVNREEIEEILKAAFPNLTN